MVATAKRVVTGTLLGLEYVFWIVGMAGLGEFGRGCVA
jgi:hypothetical protein